MGLGAGRGRLVRQMLTESVLLSAAGTVAGVVVAYFGIGVLVRIMASSRAFEHIDIEVQPDLNLLLFTAGIALLTGLLFGLAPAWYAFRAEPAWRLRQTGRRGDTWFWRLFGKGLVAAQVALSIFLVTAAAVFLNHLSRLRNFDLGFRSDHVLLVTLDPSHSGYKPEQLAAPYQELLSRLAAIPRVRSASISGCTPLEGCGSGSRYPDRGRTCGAARGSAADGGGFCGAAVFRDARHTAASPDAISAFGMWGGRAWRLSARRWRATISRA